MVLRRLFLIVALVLLYAVAWVFGEHGHTHFLETAKLDGTHWTCAEEGQGPFWDNGKDRNPICRVPVRQCPMLWFPVASQVPCPYKDPMGGPYTEDDLHVLKQIQRQRQ
jgi:hypothetical protein